MAKQTIKTLSMLDVFADSPLGLDQMRVGCLQRIADAMERQAAAAEDMAKDRQKMEGEIRYLRSRNGELTKTVERLERTNAALRGSRYTAAEVRKAAQDHVENVLKINRLPRKKGAKR